MTDTFVSSIARTVADVLGRWIPTGVPVSLLDVPTHTNVGDHAITLGELTYLSDAGNPVTYVAALNDYSPDRLRERSTDGVILLHGGGNLGDLWPHHQRFRERVLFEFPEARVVQLPQSVSFQSPESLERARRAFAGHPDFTLLVRDFASLEFAERHFECRVELCPDSALVLGVQARRCVPDTDVLVLARTDHEASMGLGDGGGSVETLDWVGAGSKAFRAVQLTSRRLGAIARASRIGFALASPVLARTYQYLARERLEFGLSLLSRGRAVITDRLHGHILCTMLGIPHVICDTGHGKVVAFHRTWTAEAPLVVVSQTFEDAVETARGFVGRPAH